MSIAHHSSNLSNPFQLHPTYIPSQHPPIQTGSGSSSAQGHLGSTTQSETASASAPSNIFAVYHPYHLAAAAAFASSQMVELQRSYTSNHNQVPLNVVPAAQDEDMPSSTTQEQPLVINTGPGSPAKLIEEESARRTQSSKDEKVFYIILY